MPSLPGTLTVKLLTFLGTSYFLMTPYLLLYRLNRPKIKAGCTSKLKANLLSLIFSPPKIGRNQHGPPPQSQAPALSSHLCKQGAECNWESYLLPPYHPHQEGVGEGATAHGLDRCKLPRGQGVTGLNWLRESSLPRENEDKQEKNTGEGQQQRQLLCGFCPWGCVQSLRPTDSPGA